MRDKKGFSIMEAVIGLTILVIVGAGIAVSVAKSLQSAVNVQKTGKAKLLADMVFEQYNSRIGSPDLSSFDHDPSVTAGAFFATGTDNLGFDGYLIKSHATCTTTSINCAIDVDIAWQDGAKPMTKRFTRNFSISTASKTGGTVDVWVKQNCAATQAAIIANCPGVGGFEITATPADPTYRSYRGSAEVIGYTLQDGHAILRNVQLGPTVINAKRPGSAAGNALSNFSQGYYHPPAPGSIITPFDPLDGTTSSDSRNLVVGQAVSNVALFNEFLPLGKFFGHVQYSDSSPGAGLLINTRPMFASNGFGFIDFTGVLTDAAGNYTLYNVVPNIAFTVVMAGDPGSHPRLTPADISSGFRQGANGGSTGGGGIVPVPTDLLAPTPFTQIDLPAYRNGWLDVTVLKPDGTPEVGTAYIRAGIGESFFAGADIITAPIIGGHIALYNMYAADTYTRLYIWTPPVGAYAGSYARTAAFKARNDQGNFLTVTLDSNYTLSGILQTSGGATLSGLTVSFSTIANTKVTSAPSTPLGFSLAGFSPYAPSVPTPNPLPNYGAPFQVNGVMITVEDPASSLWTTFQGQVIDAAANVPIAGMNLQVEGLPGTVATDSSGNFTLSRNVPFKQNILVNVSCDPGPRTCTINSNVVVDFSRITTRLLGQRAGYLMKPFPVTSPGGAVGVSIPALMVAYPVTGFVKDKVSLVGLAGISVCNFRYASSTVANYALAAAGPYHFTKDDGYAPGGAAGGWCTQTDVNGAYTLYGIVTGRNPGAGDYGHIILSILPGQHNANTGSLYDGYNDGDAGFFWNPLITPTMPGPSVLTATDTSSAVPQILPDILLDPLQGSL